jgi:hypothetical protein
VKNRFTSFNNLRKKHSRTWNIIPPEIHTCIIK